MNATSLLDYLARHTDPDGNVVLTPEEAAEFLAMVEEAKGKR